MKRGLILIMLFCLVAGPALASGHNVAGAKLDMPDLVKISNDVSIGMEVGKDIMNEIGYNAFDYIEDDKGFFGYLKVTVKWSILDLTKKAE